MTQGIKTLAIRVISALFVATSALPVAAQVETGAPAPEFRLQDQNGEWHALDDFTGQWLVVYFYPRADTPGCTTQGCSFRDNIYAFRGVGAEVVGISTDPVDRQKAFSDKYSLPFAILSDESGAVARDYGVLIDQGTVNFARRETFLISPEGRIARHYQNVNPETHTEEVLGDLLTLAGAGEADPS
jgi:peroxiredoxin Q/BCP